ncbi:hypothetical protein KAU11_12250, partial [Candidatus Babeliales bacterium]|nr:hypothetical protein [Candidatus Babeliales bacterium]
KVLSAIFEDGSHMYYNKQIGAVRFRCDGHTEATKKKISEAATGRTPSDETRQKMSDTRTGLKPSEETRQKMSDWQLGNNRSEETKVRISKALLIHTTILQINKTTNETIAVWGSIKEAMIATGVNISCISACCRGKQKTAGGFKWKYV